VSFPLVVGNAGTDVFLSFFTGGEHIGVITPYHAQRCKILDLLYKEPKFRDIKVGSVEEFQGQVCFFVF